MEAKEELRKLRESTGMNRKEFCEYFEIPYMTETDWELPESVKFSFFISRNFIPNENF